MSPAALERWKNRFGGTVLVAAVLLFATIVFLYKPTTPQWMLVLIVPAAFIIWMLLEWTFGDLFKSLSRRLIARSIRPGAKNYFEVVRFRGVPLIVHWTFFALPLAFLPSAFFWPAMGWS